MVKQSRLHHYVKFPLTHSGQHDKTFLVLAMKHQKNSLAITVAFMHCIFLKKKKKRKEKKWQ